MRRGDNRRGARVVIALASLMTMGFSSDAGAEPENVCEREMTRAARAYEVPLGVLYAVALTETGQRGALHAFAMNIEGRPAFNDALDQALLTFDHARQRGARLIDIGCMQINHHYHGRRFTSVVEMFDPGRNVDYAARFLRELHKSEGSWTAAVARYHAGPGNAPAQRTYVCAVIGNMVASGFGQWTPESRAFCHRA